MPGAFLAFIVNISLQYGCVYDLERLQLLEGKVAACLAPIMWIVHNFGQGGSMAFWALTHDLKEHPHTNWMKDQQHTLDLACWFTVRVDADIIYRRVFTL